MMVTFVSECEKKALNRTRRVLDAFANRIGARTWQTVITEEGLQAVKKTTAQKRDQEYRRRLPLDTFQKPQRVGLDRGESESV